MAIYDQSVYGIDTYGAATSTITTTLTADPTPTGYAGIQLSWVLPVGTWTRIRLVRNRLGFPATADDGTVLLDQAQGSANSSYTDNGLRAPAFYYYALFIQQSANGTLPWTLSAQAIGQSIADHGYTNFLLQRLPSMYTSLSGAIDEEPDSTSAMAKFLGAFGADLNRLRDFHDHLNYVQDPDTVHGNLLPYLLQTYGYTYEPEIGMKQNRLLAKNAVFLRQTKGTTTGVTSLAKAVTGWGAVQLPLLNLMLDDDSSSFENSTGLWLVTAGQADLAQQPLLAFNNGVSTVKGCLQITCDNTGAVSLSTTGSSIFGLGAYGSGFYNLQNTSSFAIPVTGDLNYTVSAYFRSATTVVQPLLDIVWYDVNGAVISTSSGVAGASTTTSDWSCRVFTTALAPSTAKWAAPTIRYTSLTALDVQYVDAVQFEPTPSNLMNYASSSFEDGTVGGWTAGANTTLSVGAVAEDGVKGLALTCTAPGTVSASLATARPTVTPGVTYTYSFYVFSTVSRAITAQINWLNAANGTISSSSATVTTTVNGWNQISVTGLAPALSVAAQTVVSVASAVAADVYNVDGIQFEAALAATPFRSNPSLYTTARSVRVKLIAPRVQEVINAGFDANVTQWTVSNGTTAFEGTITNNGGTGSCKVTPSAVGQVIVTQKIQADAGRPFTLAAQFYAASGSTGLVQIDWTDYLGNSLGSSVGTITTLPATTWTQVSLVGATVPTPASLVDANTATTYGSGPYGGGAYGGAPTWVTGAVKLIVNPNDAVSLYGSSTYGSLGFGGTGSTTAPVTYLDDVQAEQGAVLLTYFDGRSNPAEVRWEGAVTYSRLHLYPNFGARTTRLSDLMTDQIPLGSTFSLLTALPRGAT